MTKYINTSFYTSLGDQKSWIVDHAWDIRNENSAYLYGNAPVTAKVVQDNIIRDEAFDETDIFFLLLLIDQLSPVAG